jgi:hypothetical protein
VRIVDVVQSEIEGLPTRIKLELFKKANVDYNVQRVFQVEDKVVLIGSNRVFILNEDLSLDEDYNLLVPPKMSSLTIVNASPKSELYNKHNHEFANN